MAAYHWKRPLLAQSAWMVVSLVGLVSFQLFSVESYFLLSFIGLLSVMLVFAPVRVQPKWWSRLGWLALAGFFVFVYILYRRITMI